MSTVGPSTTGIGPSRVTATRPVALTTAGSGAPLPRARYNADRTARGDIDTQHPLIAGDDKRAAVGGEGLVGQARGALLTQQGGARRRIAHQELAGLRSRAKRPAAHPATRRRRRRRRGREDDPPVRRAQLVGALDRRRTARPPGPIAPCSCGCGLMLPSRPARVRRRVPSRTSSPAPSSRPAQRSWCRSPADERRRRTARHVDDTDLGTRRARTHGQHGTAQQHRSHTHGVPAGREPTPVSYAVPAAARGGGRHRDAYGFVVESVNVSVLL